MNERQIYTLYLHCQFELSHCYNANTFGLTHKLFFLLVRFFLRGSVSDLLLSQSKLLSIAKFTPKKNWYCSQCANMSSPVKFPSPSFPIIQQSEFSTATSTKKLLEQSLINNVEL
ncbi:hypothetical protein K501DRAFT_266574 [Backusella circina FSU 941]|nr:hypothetical protein K501DRAFT_266574 [Backusella circina FSU 941]